MNRELSDIEQAICDAKDYFDQQLQAMPELNRRERFALWETFLRRWDADLKQLTWPPRRRTLTGG